MSPALFRKSPKEKPMPVSERLQRFCDEHTGEDVSINDIMQAMHESGFGLIMAMLVLPNCVPVPIPPGGSTILSLPLLFIAVQMLFGMDAPWLPSWLGNKTLKHSTLTLIISKIVPKLQKLEKLLKPRFSVASSTTGERMVGFFWLIFAISIAVPLPMTNFIPGVGILIMALGLLSKDGVVMVMGTVVGILGVTFTVTILALGTQAALGLFPFIGDVLEVAN